MSTPHPVDRWNTAFRALAATPRRELVAHLNERPAGEPVSLPEAAIHPAVTVDRDRLVLDLHHCHLPHLADRGYVEWTDEPFSARRGPRFGELATVLEAVVDAADRYPSEMVAGCHRLKRAAGRD